jgi:hypothetical protein
MAHTPTPKTPTVGLEQGNDGSTVIRGTKASGRTSGGRMTKTVKSK